MSVQGSQSSIQRGQKAAYVVRVSAQNGSASNVSVTLASQPSSQKPTFTGGCAKGDGTAKCAISSVSDKQPTVLQAQIPVDSGATSVTSVKLTATASVATSAKWTPPSATATVTVTSVTPATPATPSTPASSGFVPPVQSSAGASFEPAPPLGPIPNLNGASSSIISSSSLIGAGNASDLFPAIVPSATPGASPGIGLEGGSRAAEPVANSSALAFGKPGLTPQLAGLIALAVAVVLTVTRLSFLRRFRVRKQRG